jgi:predicted dehydrogenase
LIAACDLNKQQRDQARIDFADIRCYDSADDLAVDPDVDLIIVATPPNSHAEICLRMMAAGKHVVCEKPLAIDRNETEALISAQERYGVHLSCHQNRRFDADYLAVRRVIADGLIGTPFYLETFVGSFAHPCGYWHSHAPVSGGTAYDWGAHYLDWIVSLFPDPIETVIGTRHNRVWHDVTNADQERIQIRFNGGAEADFIHSDVAAVRKPKWYLLGTQGALVGHWQDVSAYAHEPDHYFNRYDIPATEMPPDIRIFHRQAAGDIIEMRPAILPGEHFAFHRNLADHLLTGEPLAAPLRDSVKVVAILEAAARSMANGGSLEVIDA